MSPGRTPGSGAPGHEAHRLARGEAAPEPDHELALLAASEATPAASAASRSSATSTRRRTGGGIGPKRSVTSWRNAARSPAVRARARRR